MICKFKKIVAVDETLLNEQALAALVQRADSVVVYHDFPREEQEVVCRIGDADCLLVSFHTPIGKNVLSACPALRYVGMCCTLYSPESSNVDVSEARKRGITVTGIKDYGDEGVVEYVISELVRLLHGFGPYCWHGRPCELTHQHVGIIGLGKTGRMIADALQFLGAEIRYFSRTRKPEAEQAGMSYSSLPDLLQWADIVCTCLPRNNYLLGHEEFSLFGNGKILVNTSIGPTFELEALKCWLSSSPDNYYLCDATGMGNLAKQLSSFPTVLYTPHISGMSVQSIGRLSEKVLANMDAFLAKQIQGAEGASL